MPSTIKRSSHPFPPCSYRLTPSRSFRLNMKNNKRIASSSSPLSGSWIIIAVLVLRVRDVRTWTTLPPSKSLSRRHLPQQTSSVTFLRYIEKPSGTQVVSKLTGRKNFGSSSLPMVMDTDADSQQQEEFSKRTYLVLTMEFVCGLE